MDERITCFIPDGANCTGYKESKVSATLCIKYHYGCGGDAALIVEKKPCVISLQANGIDRCDTAGCNGRGWNDSGKSYTLNTIDRHAICYEAKDNGEGDKVPTKYIVRRITPTECARLQGFPDWWTDGANGSDSNIYKMWGNGIALPCAADVIGRLAKELEKET